MDLDHLTPLLLPLVSAGLMLSSYIFERPLKPNSEPETQVSEAECDTN